MQNKSLAEAKAMVLSLIKDIKKDSVIIAIDGRCASGKTTLAAAIAAETECNVFHMDDFFLQPHMRTEERLSSPGENVDHERFLSEVLIPLKEGREFSYSPYDCRNGSLGEPVKVTKKPLSIVEGSYACHRDLIGYYDICIFSDVTEEEQMRRIKERNGERAVMFKEKWIPLEERYFELCRIREKCAQIID